jgi:hypothetical protein
MFFDESGPIRGISFWWEWPYKRGNTLLYYLSCHVLFPVLKREKYIE